MATFLGCIGPDSEDPNWDKKPVNKWIIEFRSGNYFQNLKADNGGPAQTAMKFNSKEEAETFMRKHEWILFNGGMAIMIQVVKK